jgi:predicted XRE-type DNA-binding protein
MKKNLASDDQVEAVSKGSENIFADLGFADASERLVKAQLMVQLNRICDDLLLTQKGLTHLLKIPQSKVSALRNFKSANFSAERIVDFLTRLGCNVEITVSQPALGMSGTASVAMQTAAMVSPVVQRPAPSAYANPFAVQFGTATRGQRVLVDGKSFALDIDDTSIKQLSRQGVWQQQSLKAGTF